MNFQQINTSAREAVVRTFSKKAIIITQQVVIALIALLVIWDIYLYLNGEETISYVIFVNAKNDLFLISWVWGILAAHLFFTRKAAAWKVPEILGISILVLFSVLLYLLARFIDVEIPEWMHVVLLVGGSITGFFLWPQCSDD